MKLRLSLIGLFVTFSASAAVSNVVVAPNGVPAFNAEFVALKTQVATVSFDSSSAGAARITLSLEGTKSEDLRMIGLAKKDSNGELGECVKGKISSKKAEFSLSDVEKGKNEYSLVLVANDGKGAKRGKLPDLRRKLVVEGKKFRMGSVITAPGQEVVDVNRKSGYFRIPGIAETTKGSLVAIFDNRYNHGGDLPADITVGVSISKDKGLTWSPITTVLDYAKIPGAKAGIGDACILVDPSNGRIWVAALRTPDTGHPIWSSRSGSADITNCGQMILAYSDDEGKSWSKPINITSAVKRIGDEDTAEWGLLFQGPGNGIAMSDGTLVFPCQIWPGANTGKKWRYGCLVYSKDHGKTWQSSKAMPWAGSESTVVETTPGTLLLNTREGSMTAKTTNLGETWEKFQTTPNIRRCFCQSALVKLGKDLFFSTPDSNKREKMTVRKSEDWGKTWEKSLCYDPRSCAGYSSLCTVDNNSVGVIYEGNSPAGFKGPAFHYFVRIAANEIK